MDQMYKDLFIEVCSSASSIAEQVMDYDVKNNDNQGLKTATLMRDDYFNLKEKITNDVPITRNDYAKLMTGMYIIVNNLKDKIIMLQRTVSGYETSVMPKVERILNEAKTDAEVESLAKELFVSEKN